jgi:butyrate kinase
MYDIEQSFDQQILSTSKSRPTVVFIEPKDPRVVEAACHLTRFIRPVFLASEKEVRQIAATHLGGADQDRLNWGLSESTFVEIAQRADLVAEFAQGYLEYVRGTGRELSLAEAKALVSQPGLFGICAVKFGHADTVVGGAVHETKDYFRPMVRMLAKDPFVCEAGVFVLPDEHPTEIFPHNIVVFGDVGVNATMTPDTLARTAVATSAVARDLFPEDILPQINAAIVSYSDRGSDEGPSPEMVRQATELLPGYLTERLTRGERYKTIRIEGEVKINAALSQRSAMYYRAGKDEVWPGSPNVIICPNLDMGNLLYHIYATRFPQAKKFPVLFGLRFAGVDLPMDCTPEDVRLAVKASVLRLHKYGEWTQTPKDTFFRSFRVLAINPGSTSTKIAVYEGERERFTKELKHTPEELHPFDGQPITAQFHFRKDAIEKFLHESGLEMSDIDAVSGRGGLLHPMPHGAFEVNEAMLKDLATGIQGQHASNLGGLIAHELVEGSGKPAFIVDPVVVDEVADRVKLTGVKGIRRKVISHALNQIATAHRYAEDRGLPYEKVNLIVAHLGGGITVGAHKRGRYIDVNDGLGGEGPMSPERAGSMPGFALVDYCFSGQHTKEEVKKKLVGKGGILDLLGTTNMMELEKRYQAGDGEVIAVMDAMAYQIAKEITSLWPAFDGEHVDQILITGGIARCKPTIEYIKKCLAGLPAGVTVYPGENEMLALVMGALRVLTGKEPAKTYAPQAQ